MRPISCLALMLAAAASPAAAKSYRAERYDVTLHLDRQGVLTVLETVEFEFSGGPFHFVFRDLDTRYTDGISEVRASGPGRTEITYGSPIRVRWNFEPMSDFTRTFTLSYTVAGTIQKTTDGDLFVWHPLPREKGYPIGRSRIRVEYPSDVSPTTAHLRRPDADWEIARGAATAELGGLRPERYPEIALEFPAGTFFGPPPRWQSQKTTNNGDFLAGLLKGLAAGLVITLLVALWTKRSVSGQPPEDRTLRLPEPPDSLPPAAAAALIGHPNPGAGILVDLARRGIVRIEETAKGRFTGRKFKVTLLQPAARLAPYEQLFLDAGFRGGKAEMEMTAFATRTQGAWYKIGKAIQTELAERGLVDPVEARARTHRVMAGAPAVIFGPTAVLAGLIIPRSVGSGVLTAAGAALTFIGIGVLIAASRISRWTDAGAPVAARWRAFSRHLRDAARGRALSPLSADSNCWLPYAAAFGVAAQLVRHYKKEGRTLALPEWFGAFETGADGSDAFVAFLGTTGADGSGGAGAAAGGGAAGGGGGASGAG